MLLGQLIRSSRADVICLQEVNSLVLKHLSLNGYYSTGIYNQDTMFNNIVFSRYDYRITTHIKVPKITRIIPAITIRDPDVTICNVHLSARAKKANLRSIQIERVAYELIYHENLIIAGDVNMRKEEPIPYGFKQNELINTYCASNPFVDYGHHPFDRFIYRGVTLKEQPRIIGTGDMVASDHYGLIGEFEV